MIIMRHLCLRPIMGRKKLWHDISDPEVDRLVLGPSLGAAQFSQSLSHQISDPGGSEHFVYFSICFRILGIIIPTD